VKQSLYHKKTAKANRAAARLTGVRQGRTFVLSGLMTRKNALTLALVLTCAASFGRCRAPAGPAGIRLGVSASIEGRWDEARARFSEALAADPSSAAAHNNLAVACEKTGLWDEAERHYGAALKLDPGNVRIQDNFNRFRENRNAAAKKLPAPKGHP
jgi:Tfp pilus assembly protein PilF